MENDTLSDLCEIFNTYAYKPEGQELIINMVNEVTFFFNRNTDFLDFLEIKKEKIEYRLGDMSVSFIDNQNVFRVVGLNSFVNDVFTKANIRSHKISKIIT
jgi:hypothetical protein